MQCQTREEDSLFFVSQHYLLALRCAAFLCNNNGQSSVRFVLITRTGHASRRGA